MRSQLRGHPFDRVGHLLQATQSLTPLGFDERFRRLWEYYLAYCEAGFLSGNIDVRQVVFAKTD